MTVNKDKQSVKYEKKRRGLLLAFISQSVHQKDVLCPHRAAVRCELVDWVLLVHDIG